jgi:hypothetical protein
MWNKSENLISKEENLKKVEEDVIMKLIENDKSLVRRDLEARLERVKR